jgi:hypothetical protein
MRQLTLQPTVTKGADYTGSDYVFSSNPKELIVTLKVDSCEQDTADETYDIYITTGDGVSSWDIIHFPQLTTDATYIYTAGVNCRLAHQNVTSAVPGVAAVDPSTFKTDTAGAGNGIKTLTAGYVRHGPVGNRIGHQLVVAGTIVVGIVYSITVSMR